LVINSVAYFIACCILGLSLFGSNASQFELLESFTQEKALRNLTVSYAVFPFLLKSLWPILFLITAQTNLIYSSVATVLVSE
jgi:hypothetical protein